MERFKKLKRLRKLLKEFDTYDRVYYGGKLSSALIVLLSLLSLGCFILGFIVFK